MLNHARSQRGLGKDERSFIANVTGMKGGRNYSPVGEDGLRGTCEVESITKSRSKNGDKMEPEGEKEKDCR